MSNLSRRGLMGTVAGVSSLAVLAACGKDEPTADPSSTQPQESSAPPPSDNSPTESSPQETSPQESSPEESPSEQDSTPAGGGDEKTVKIGKVFNDTVVGDKVEILSAVRHASLPKAKSEIDKGAELVLLEVKLTPSKQYGGAVSALAFELVGADGDKVKARSTFEDELSAAGKKALGIASRRKGPVTGWVGVLMRKGKTADTYEGIYTRRKAKVIGQDKTLAEFVGKFSVPA